MIATEFVIFICSNVSYCYFFGIPSTRKMSLQVLFTRGHSRESSGHVHLTKRVGSSPQSCNDLYETGGDSSPVYHTCSRYGGQGTVQGGRKVSVFIT